jgi:hypothetical protein
MLAETMIQCEALTKRFVPDEIRLDLHAYLAGTLNGLGCSSIEKAVRSAGLRPKAERSDALDYGRRKQLAP